MFKPTRWTGCQSCMFAPKAETFLPSKYPTITQVRYHLFFPSGTRYILNLIGKTITEVWEVLIEAGADVATLNDQGETPLHIACLRGMIFSLLFGLLTFNSRQHQCGEGAVGTGCGCECENQTRGHPFALCVEERVLPNHRTVGIP